MAKKLLDLSILILLKTLSRFLLAKGHYYLLCILNVPTAQLVYSLNIFYFYLVFPTN